MFGHLRPIRIWFCIAAALVAASIADPLVEFASNGGAFGAGSFTDHSNWDVFPALGAGVALVAVYIALRVRRALLRAGVHESLRPSALLALLPYVFAVQIALLYVMETAEQFVVAGHALGPARATTVYQNGVVQQVALPSPGYYLVTFTYSPNVARATAPS